MARMQVQGMDEVNAMLGRLGGKGTAIAKAAMYEGAREITDEIGAEIARMKESEPGKPRETQKIYRSLTALERRDLEKGLGIAKFRREGDEIMTVIGFAGYGSRKTKTYPSGLPNALLARAIAKPSALRRGRKFTRIALKRKESAAVGAMAKKADEMIEKIIAE